MDKDREEQTQENSNDEMDWDAFFKSDDDEEWEKEKAKKKKRRSLIVKLVSLLLVVSMTVTGLQVWFNVFNLPAIRFVEVSNRLSNQHEVKEYRKAVVTIEWAGVKGTGFTVDSSGLIVTNEHVVNHTNTVTVQYRSGDSYTGKVIAKDANLDIAIVDIEATNLPTLELDNADKDWSNEKIMFIGNPLSFTQIANEGEIKGNVVLRDWEVPVMMIEAPIYRGNSGSPVINKDGKVIGVIFATLPNPTIETEEIVGLAVPSSHILKLLEEVEFKTE
ncbi:S1C family serine protease [Fredinandcohnia sp. 179-A 10B2 NHS]|uniref:S1C family serine protease n=1 Tax=Fredinandcohnia sp. 179-A 10B2 NHS TaxID=3235176 RepID=UPI0039A18F29